ncbi:MAG: AIR carboxylase family protein, partial [Bacteroidetes bacterium]
MVDRPLNTEAQNRKEQRAVIIMGSKSDSDFSKNITDELERYGIDYDTIAMSAHKQTEALLELLNTYNESGGKIIYVTVAGMTDALSGVVKGNVISPVISCPPPRKDAPGGYYFLSSLESPSKISNMTILNPKNAALAVAEIFALNNPQLASVL